ncbi:hypothetical protein K470DRAFT_259172 [Piedraia hortae CBS 480.64]|uniref:SWI5-dependent HO expression protein 3 n=1 Tax=Piedraia hortae CBS 480.64 TaxID=1314780 RepID=A0A6A7BW02_9PEZI|nr:hypothetical protein K470DRAFT_259172 [Piedraia hortae CBS 480.64]
MESAVLRTYRVNSNSPASPCKQQTFRIEEQKIDMKPSSSTIRHVSGLAPSTSANNSAPVPAPDGNAQSMDDGPQWSAIGHATTGGKSGRIIERLMSDNDKLNRQLKAAELKVLAYQDELALFKPRMDALKHENENMLHASSVDSSLLARRERKIEELKSDLKFQTERAEKAESSARRSRAELDELRKKQSRENQALVDEAKHAVTHSEILETSYRQLKTELATRKEVWENDLKALKAEQRDNKTRFARLDLVHEQMRLENERMKKVNEDLRALWDGCERDYKASLEGAQREEELLREKRKEMQDTLDKMKWVMALNAERGGGGRQGR